MNTYITGTTIRALREGKKLTQSQLASLIGVSSKTVSKWETAKGFPDISLIEPLSKALGISVPELLSGEQIINRNMSCNMLRTKFYVCPICGKIIHASGDAMISCCGITLPALEPEEPDEAHLPLIEPVEDEQFITVHHEMTKDHYLSFAAVVTSDRIQLVKFYPEGNAEARFKRRGRGILYIYCNRHGLMKQRI